MIMSDFAAEIRAAVEAKLIELDAIPYGPSTGRRLEMAGRDKDGASLSPEQLRENRRLLMTDVAERLGLHFFQMTSSVLLDQLITMSVIKNHDTAGLLKSLINSFLITYTSPEASDLAYRQLQGLEVLRAYIEKGVPLGMAMAMDTPNSKH